MYAEPVDLVPIVIFLVGFGIAAIAIWARSKKNQLEHQERMMALEKGVPLPEKVFVPPKPKNPYLWGFVFIAIGLPMFFGFMFYEHDEGAWIFGGIIFLIGVAILAANLLHKRDLKKENINGVVQLEDKESDTGTIP